MSRPNRNSPNNHASLPAIVLIERDAITLELYQRELRKSFMVFAFTELMGVLEVVKSKDIQAIIIEPEIESGKGWELIHTIYETLPDRFIPVIVCSTCDTHPFGLTGEFTKYLTKPVLPQTLKEKTLEIVNTKGRSRKNL
jgi:response regulator RpfG family c-di-GMP phosphodiesterase